MAAVPASTFAIVLASGCSPTCRDSSPATDAELVAATLDLVLRPRGGPTRPPSAVVVYDYMTVSSSVATPPGAAFVPEVRPATLASFMERNREPAELDPFPLQAAFPDVDLYFVDEAELETAFDPDDQWDAFIERYPGAYAAFQLSRPGLDCDESLTDAFRVDGPGGSTGYLGVFNLNDETWSGSLTQTFVE